MSHPYSDDCPCGDCTQHFNDVVGAMFKGKEANMVAKKPLKKTLKSKSTKKTKITK